MPSRRRLLGQLCTAAAIGLSAAPGVPAAAGPRQSVAWPRRYAPHGTRFEGIVPANDEDVLLVGSRFGRDSWDLWLGAVAPDGELRWSRTVDEPERLYVRDIAARDDGYTVSLWYGSSENSMLFHFDEDGHEQWRRSLDVGFDRGLVGTEEGYLVHGRDKDAAAVALVEVDGSVRWLRTYDGSEVVSLRRLDDGLLLAGISDDDAWVQRVSHDGGPDWTHTYGGIHNDGAAVAFPRGEGAVYGGWTSSPADNTRGGMLVRVDSDGDRVWRRTYGFDGLDGAADARSLEDGLVMVGRPSDGDYRGGRLLFVDEWGQVDRRLEVEGLYGAQMARFGDRSLAVAGDTGSQINLVKVETNT